MSGGTPRAYYVTTLDRIGLAILAGGVLAGLVAALLMLAGGQRSPAALGLAWALGALFAMLGIVAVAGPLWLALHLRNRRGPLAAATTAGVVALIVFTLGQTIGTSGGGYRWASAVGTSTFVALAAAAIGVVMQRVAYRRLL